MSLSFTLNCLVVGDDPDQLFPVRISKKKRIDSLKSLIKKMKAPHLDHIAASDLDLWQVSFPIDDLETELGALDLDGHLKLSSKKILSKFFTDVPKDCLHIIVKVPGVQTVAAPNSTQHQLPSFSSLSVDLNPIQSCSSSITIINDPPAADTKVVASTSPDAPYDQAPNPVERDNVFYSTITFQVEDTLFRVFKSGFEVKGSSFETMLSLPQAPGEIMEGTDDSSPIYLHGITKVSFRNFLRVLYPNLMGSATNYSEWIAALDLAIMWDFKEIRKTCIEALSKLIESRSTFDKILLARKYKVKKWLRDAYFQLLQQKKALEFGDDICTSQIDLITAARLLYIRERKHCQLQCTDYDCQGSYYFSNDEAYKRIDEVFADEIAEMQDD